MIGGILYTNKKKIKKKFRFQFRKLYFKKENSRGVKTKEILMTNKFINQGANFLSLPSEIWETIFSWLTSDELITCQLVSKEFFLIADNKYVWIPLLLDYWKGKQWKNNHCYNFRPKIQDTTFLKLDVREMKQILRENGVKYADCLTREDYEEKIRQLKNRPDVAFNYLEEDKRLKLIFYESRRYFNVKQPISAKELVDMQWLLVFNGDDSKTYFPEFFQNGNFLLYHGAGLMTWKIIGTSVEIQDSQRKMSFTASRTDTGGWKLNSHIGSLSTIDSRKRIDTQGKQLSIEYRLKVASDIKTEANQLYSDGEFENAIQLYKSIFKYVRSIPNDLAQGMIYSQDKGQHPLAKQLISVKVSACLNIGTCFMQLKMYDDALASAQRALRFDPISIKALFRRAQAFYELGNFKRSLIDLEDCRTRLKADANQNGDFFVDELYKKCKKRVDDLEKYYQSVANVY